MNKKYSIMVGVLAGGLLLSANTAEASMTTGNSQTTSNVENSITYKMDSPYKYVYNYNFLVNMNKLDLPHINDVLNNLFTPPNNQPGNKPSEPEKEPEVEVEKPSEPEKEPEVEVEKPSEPEKEPEVEVEKPTEPEKEPEVEVTPPSTEEEQIPDNEVNVSSVIQQVVDLTNQERAKEGLQALQMDTKLTQSAQAKSQDMKDKNYFSHTSPTYGSPFDQMKSFGVTYKSAAENIAMGQRSAQEVVKAWMESPGHRANIMSPSYTHIGVGLSDSGYYWTQQFIGK